MGFNLAKMLGLESKKPDVRSIQEFYDPRVGEFSNLLTDFAKKRLDPAYEAINPSQQSLIYNRIKSKLQPTFDEGIQSQLQDIQSMGIEGTPGAAILSKLRKDYADDLSGRATDIAINNIDQTAKERSAGVDILGNLRNSLISEAGINYNANNAANATKDASDRDMWNSIGGLFGEGVKTAMSFASPETAFASQYLDILRKDSGGAGTTKGLFDILGSGDMFSGSTKKRKMPSFYNGGY